MQRWQMTADNGKQTVYPLWKGRAVSRLALGCMHFGGSWDVQASVTEAAYERARGALAQVLEMGWNFFDHADIYCRGRSEQVFARALRELGVAREAVVIQSKCGIRMPGDGGAEQPHRYDFSRSHIMRSVEDSLRRLGTEYLDILLLHRPDALMEPEEIVRAYSKLLEQGKVRAIGVSNHTVGQMELLRTAGLPLVGHQVELNPLKTALLDAGIVSAGREPAAGHPADGVLEYNRLHGIVTQAWAPLAYGYPSGRAADWDAERVRGLAAVVAAVALKYGVSKEAVVIGWLLRHPAGIQPVIGSLDAGRLRGCNEALSFMLGREDWYRIYVAGRGHGLP